jgi:hypothetical protein
MWLHLKYINTITDNASTETVFLVSDDPGVDDLSLPKNSFAVPESPTHEALLAPSTVLIELPRDFLLLSTTTMTLEHTKNLYNEQQGILKNGLALLETADAIVEYESFAK